MLVHHRRLSPTTARAGGAVLVASAVMLPLALLAGPATAAPALVAPASSTATVVASTIDVRSQVSVRGLQTGSIDPARNRLYLADAVWKGTQQVAQIDLSTGTASLIPLGGGYAANDTAVSPLDGTVYVSHNTIGGGISVIDPAQTYSADTTPPVITSGLSGNTQQLGVGTDGRVYALHSYSGVVSVVGASTGTDRLAVVQSISVPQASTGAMAIDAPRNRLYVVGMESDTLTVVDTATDPAVVLGVVPLLPSRDVVGVGVDARTGQVILSDQVSRTLEWLTIDPTSLAVTTDRTEALAPLPAGADPWSMPSSISVRPDGTTFVVTLVYAAPSQASQVTVIPPTVSATTPVTTLTVGTMANGGILDPRAGGTLYVPSATSGTIAEITDVTLSAATTTTSAGAQGLLRASLVRSDGRAVAGSITFTGPVGDNLGVTPLQASGLAELSVPGTPVGTLDFTASVSAPAGIALTASGALTTTASISTTTLTLTTPSTVEGSTVTGEIAVAAAAGPAATGTVSVVDATGTELATATLLDGRATVTFAAPPAGTTTLTAVYAGVTDVAGSVSAPVDLVVAARVPVASAPSAVGAAGSTSTTSISGFLPGEEVVLTLHSDPVYLGTVRVDATGSGTLTFTVPAVDAGAHTIVAVGQTSGRTTSLPFTVTGSAVTAALPVTQSGATSAPVATAPRALASGLAATGSEPAPLVALGALLVLLGTGAVAAARRRVS